MVFIINFNGENVDKKFSKEFLNHVCGGRMVEHVDWNASTRKRLTVLSYHVANKLLNLNQKVVWPDGTPFKCHHYGQHSHGYRKRSDGVRHTKHRFHHHERDGGRVEEENAAAAAAARHRNGRDDDDGNVYIAVSTPQKPELETAAATATTSKRGYDDYGIVGYKKEKDRYYANDENDDDDDIMGDNWYESSKFIEFVEDDLDEGVVMTKAL
jgi:hypothetical protein